MSTFRVPSPARHPVHPAHPVHPLHPVRRATLLAVLLPCLAGVLPCLAGASALAQEPTAATSAADEDPRAILPAGEWAFVSYASTTFAADDIDIHRVHVGATRMLTPSVGLDLVGTAGVFERDATTKGAAADGPAASFEAIVRWHYHRAANWSAFLEGGMGLLWTREPIPAPGSDWNFVTQAGLGFTRRAGERSHVLFGARLLHVSHGSILDGGQNPGHDTGLVYLGFIRRY